MKVKKAKSLKIIHKNNKLDKKKDNFDDSKTEFEVLVEEELSEVKQKFIERAKIDKLKFRQNTDSEYFIAICFQSREHKEDFLRKTGIIKYGDKYLDGIKVAKELGIELDEKNIPPMPRFKRIDKKYRSLVKED